MSDYIVITDKCLVRPCSDLFQGWVKCTCMEQLKSYGDAALPEGIEEGLHWKEDRKLPADLMKKVLGTIHQYKNKETGYVIYRNGMTGAWDIRAPEQLGSPAHVNFFEEAHPDSGFQVVGTIHTHPEMSAFWSGTDLNDQTKKPGTLHMVFGLRDGHVAMTLCSVFMKDARYDIPFEEIVEQVDFAEDCEPVREWVEIIDRQSYRPPVPERPKPAVLSRVPGSGFSTASWEFTDDVEPFWEPARSAGKGIAYRPFQQSDIETKSDVGSDARCLGEALLNAVECQLDSLAHAVPDLHDRLSHLLECLDADATDDSRIACLDQLMLDASEDQELADKVGGLLEEYGYAPQDVDDLYSEDAADDPCDEDGGDI